MSAPILTASGLAKSYPTPSGDLPILCGLDLQIAPGRDRQHPRRVRLRQDDTFILSRRFGAH